MPKNVPVTPIYATEDLGKILQCEQEQIIDTVADLTEEQMNWKPNSTAKSALDILYHLSHPQVPKPKPTTKKETIKRFNQAYDIIRAILETPGKLNETMVWWTGEEIPVRGFVWGTIRHRSYHLGELVYLRQAMGIDVPKYYHDDER
jgi:hypothetical protein